MKPSQLYVLNEEEIRMIDDVSREVLSTDGVSIRSRELLLRLEDKGLRVDHDRYIVKFDPDQVQDVLDAAPEQIEIFSRDRSYSYKLGRKHKSRFAAEFKAIHITDVSGRERRPMCKREVAAFAKVANYLPEIDVVSPEAMPRDVPATSSILHTVDAVLSNTLKPVLFSPENDTEVSALIEMIRIMVDSQRIDHNPIGTCQFSPSSPLFWNEGTIKGFMKIAEEEFPCTILPGSLAGATSPCTLASNLVRKNCEVLSGVVIAQLINRGTPLLCYNGGGQFSMRSLTALLGTPEVTLIMTAGTQLARYYKLPTHACMPCSDAHCLDQQLGIENMMLILSGILCRTDLLVNAGMFATGETSSLEQLVIDNEIMHMVRRYADGFTVDKEKIVHGHDQTGRSPGRFPVRRIDHGASQDR
jgi:trimethylamine--corrinoid protein Co-methyltransferase